jgi:hypothetical protein
MKCRWCGTWLRAKQVIEEREDEPPGEELDHSVTLERQMQQLRDGMKKRPGDGGGPPS